MPKPQKTVLVVVADTHSGSSTGLLPPENWVGLDGQTVRLSTGQKVLWQQWEECWERVRQLRKGARLVVIHNGDAIDGKHHDTTQLVTSDIEEQKRMHLAAMDHALKVAQHNPKKDKLFYVFGTETHVGGAEDAIARDLGAEPLIMPTPANEWRDGCFIHYHLKLNINGVRFDIAHHGLPSGTRAWTKNNGLFYVAKSHYFDCIERDVQPFDYIIGSHLHEYITAMYEGIKGSTRAIMTPAFQLKTHFGHKVARNKLSSIGLVIIVIEADGRHYYEVPMLTYDEVGEIAL